ncbi:MAG: pyridoxamine 5'-phosphate oxidase family protein [Deltaproteobacteria bacterium]|nr:pyridoxamine 5'-phosphate oxidase family protein [Deltaproteobacteria bacterium]
MAESESLDINELATRTDRLEVRTQYDLDPADYRELFHNSHECFMAHVSKDGYPMISPMWYTVLDDQIYMTTIRDLRQKTAALIRNPKMSVVLTNFSLPVERVKAALNEITEFPTSIINRYLITCSRIENIKAILIKAHGEVSDDRDLRARVHHALIDKYYANEPKEQREVIVKAVDTPNRVIIRVVPIRIWHWDLGKMFTAASHGPAKG